MIKEEYIKALIEEKLAGTDLFLVSVKVKTGNQILVYIDGDRNVAISDCVALSRYVEHQYDREVEDFELHVSSAGIQQPLVMARQYQKNVGRDLEVTMPDDIVIQGTLVSAADDGFLLQEFPEKKKKKEIQAPVPPKFILYSSIKKAVILIKF